MHSNSNILAIECEKGAIEAGHEVDYVSLKGKILSIVLYVLHV